MRTASEDAWYKLAFDEDYLTRYAHRDAGEARAGVALLRAVAGSLDCQPVLDLACGAGRHMGPLRDAGTVAIGGDLSMPLLRRARAEYPGALLARLDMRHLPFADASFAVVVNFFTAFGYFEEDEENFSVLHEIARVLRPGGWFLFDFLNAVAVARNLGIGALESEERLANGDLWRVRRGLSADGRRAEKTQTRLHDGRVLREIRESVRLFHRQTLEAALATAGLPVQRLYGDYGGGDFEETSSPRLIMLAQRGAV